ncbi:MAG TPA: hypothetical protein VF451_02695, partial [Acidobacteriota bacterium]
DLFFFRSEQHLPDHQHPKQNQRPFPRHFSLANPQSIYNNAFPNDCQPGGMMHSRCVELYMNGMATAIGNIGCSIHDQQWAVENNDACKILLPGHLSRRSQNQHDRRLTFQHIFPKISPWAKTIFLPVGFF